METVIGEPVSISYFPVLRENSGKFAEFRPIHDSSGAFAVEFTHLAGKFPKRRNGENIYRNSERKAVQQGYMHTLFSASTGTASKGPRISIQAPPNGN